MIRINATIYFIVGFLLAIIGVNVLSSLSDLVTTFFEWLRAAISVKIAKCGAEIQKINGPEESHVNAIGFAVPQEMYYEDDEDEDD